MAKILILYYSGTGNTAKMAEMVRRGVGEEGGVEVELKKAEEASLEDLLEPEGILVGSPTYYGTMAWQLKKLFDESVRLHGRLEGKVGGAFTSSANLAGGNETTLLDILKAMLIHGMTVVGVSQGDHYGPVAIGPPDKRATTQCSQLAANLARALRGTGSTTP